MTCTKYFDTWKRDLLYIQYASDPVVFFSIGLYRRKPDWLKGERRHDVSPALKWYPIVTFLHMGKIISMSYVIQYYFICVPC